MEVGNALLRTCGVCSAGGLCPLPSFEYPTKPHLVPSDGGGQSQPIQPLRTNDPRNLLFTDQTAENQLRFVVANPQWSCSGSHFSFFRFYQEQATSTDAKLQTLTSRLGELRERFKQAQREIETGEVRFG